MRMVANACRNFCKCLIYVFVPLGCIFLGVLIGLQVFADAFSEQADYAADALAVLVQNADVSLNNLAGFFVSSVRELNWGDPVGAVGVLLEGDWIAAKLTEFLQLTAEEAAALQGDVNTIAANVAEGLSSAVAVFAVCVVLGVLFGYFVTNYFVRRSTVKRGFWGFWVAAVADSLLSATLVAFIAWLLSVTKAGAIVSAAVGALLLGGIALFEAYLLHGRGRVALRTAVNLKNCVFLLLSQLAVYVLAAAIGALFLWLLGTLAAAAIVIALVILAILVVNVNAESFVSQLAKKAEADSAQNKGGNV